MSRCIVKQSVVQPMASSVGQVTPVSISPVPTVPATSSESTQNETASEVPGVFTL